nr:MAG TPA: hypothetical protein [Caudoviricetes sp.]
MAPICERMLPKFIRFPNTMRSCIQSRKQPSLN